MSYPTGAQSFHAGAGTPEWGVAVCDTGDAAGSRFYARIEDADLLAEAAVGEWTGRAVSVAPHPAREGANLVVA